MPTEIAEALYRMDLLAPGTYAHAQLAPNCAGDEIYRVDVGWGTVCVKRSRTRVRRDGTPISPDRHRYESGWLRFARDVIGESVPEVLGEQEGMLAMEYLDPARHRSWIAQLRDGDISPSTAAEVGRLIGRLHAASANNFAIAQRFHAERTFHDLRIDPLFLAAGRAQPALLPILAALASKATRCKVALMHGELVPENVLVGPRGPVLVDADATCYGDPAFDVACCLAHLLMLAVWRPHFRSKYFTCFDAFWAAYAQRITWEMPEDTDARAAGLLPAVMLGSAIGDQPASFLYGARERDAVAGFARRHLVDPLPRVSAVRESWKQSFLG